jgi:hypothetical protein
MILDLHKAKIPEKDVMFSARSDISDHLVKPTVSCATGHGGFDHVARATTLRQIERRQ